MTTVTEEKKEIASLVIDYNQRVADWQPRVGQSGVTRIEAYDELGQMAYVPWFSIYAGDEIIRRVNGLYVVEVGYERYRRSTPSSASDAARSPKPLNDRSP